MTNRVRLGLIGASVAGTWSSRSHLPALGASDTVDLTAVCTTKPESAEAARKAYGARLAFHDYNTMAASPDLDAVAVVVRVPSHYGPVKAALQAGKHVYCEWPLGRTTAEAEELAALAKSKGLTTAVGLQARVNPTLLHMKALIEDGYVDEIVAVHVKLMREGVLSRPSNRVWQRDGSLGANTLTIANGHTLDALRFVAGPFREVSAVVTTQVKQWLDTGTKEMLDVTSPDNILVNGWLANGAVVSSHVNAIPYAGSGYRMEIYGRNGTLVATGDDSPQLGEVFLHGAQGTNKLEPIEIPAHYRIVPPGTPNGEPMNVGQMYARFAQAIGGSSEGLPDFHTAVALHKFIDAIAKSSETGTAQPAQ